MRCAGHVARMGRCEMLKKFWSEKVRGRDHLVDIDVRGTLAVLVVLNVFCFWNDVKKDLGAITDEHRSRATWFYVTK
jgi:hypothetical protein